MGVANLHAIPRARKTYARAETTFGTIIQPLATSAIRMLTSDFGAGTIERVDRADNRTTRDLLERITGNKPPIEWSMEGYLIPSGAAGTAPDVGELLKAAFGVETIVGGTSVTYATTDTQGTQKSLTLVDQAEQVISEHLVGAIANEVKVSGSGGEPPKIAFTGVAANHVLTGRSALTAAFTGSTCTVSDGSMFQVGSLVGVVQSDGTTVRDTNSGAGFPVTAVSVNDVTVTGSPASTAIGDILVPFTPAATVAGNPISGKDFSVTLGGTAIRATQYEVTLNNNFNTHADEAGNQTFADFDEGWRMVSGKVTFRARQDWIKFMAERTELATNKAIVLTLGTGAGKICTITMSYCEYEFAQVGKPEQGVAMFELPFRALGSSGADSITMAFT